MLFGELAAFEEEAVTVGTYTDPKIGLEHRPEKEKNVAFNPNNEFVFQFVVVLGIQYDRSS